MAYMDENAIRNGYLEILLHFPSNIEWPKAYCPLQMDTTTLPYKLKLPVSNYARETQTLTWFKRQYDKLLKEYNEADLHHEIYLQLPKKMNKFDRRRWHKNAHILGLFTHSSGIGMDRQLMIFPTKIEEEPLPNLSEDDRIKAIKIWQACQLENDFCHYSKGEVLEMMASASGIPSDLEKVYYERNMMKLLDVQMELNDAQGVKDILDQNPGLLYKSLQNTPGHPIHMACANGNKEIVVIMTEISDNHFPQKDLMELRDSNSRTPYDVAKLYNRDDVCEYIISRYNTPNNNITSNFEFQENVGEDLSSGYGYETPRFIYRDHNDDFLIQNEIKEEDESQQRPQINLNASSRIIAHHINDYKNE